MSECHSCGAHVSPGEHFCGNCGMPLVPSAEELKTDAPNAGDDLDVQPREGRAWANTLDDETPAIVEQASAPAPAEVHEPSGSLETTVVAPETDEPSAPLSSNYCMRCTSLRQHAIEHCKSLHCTALCTVALRCTSLSYTALSRSMHCTA